jgi:hypothetical protein
VKWLGEEMLGQWPGLSSMVVVESVRQDLGDVSGKVTTERRLYISSHASQATSLRLEPRIPDPGVTCLNAIALAPLCA